MPFSLDLLPQLLDPAYGKKAIKKQKIEYLKEGPAHLNKWLWCMEGSENSWPKPKEAGKTDAKGKLIISNGFLGKAAPTPEELSLFFALIDRYDVYLWPGPQVSFDVCKPVSSASEFWRTRDTIISAAKDEVEQGLSQQGIETSQYVVLDFPSYQALMDCLNTSTLKPIHGQPIELDEKQLIEIPIKEFQSLPVKKIKLAYPSAEEINAIKQFNLDELEVKNLQEQLFLTLHQQLLEEKPNFSLTIDQVHNEKISWTLPSDYVKKLTLKHVAAHELSFYPEKINTAEKNNALEALSIQDDCTIQNLNLENCSQLKYLKIENVECNVAQDVYRNVVYKIDLHSLTHLEELRIENNRSSKKYSVANINNNVKLKKIDLCTCILPLWELYELINLEEISLTKSILKVGVAYASITDCDLRNFEKLKTLKLIECNEFLSTSNFEPIHPTLEVLVLSHEDTVKHINFSRCPNLKEVVIQNTLIEYSFDENSSDRKIDFENIQNLTELERLSLKGQYLPKLVLKNPTLNYLELKEVKAEAINLILADLEKLVIYEKSGAPLNFSECPKLKMVELSFVDDPEYIFSNLHCLENVNIIGNSKLINIDMRLCHKLTSFFVQDANNLEAIDFSLCESLEQVDIKYCHKFQELNLSTCKKIKSICLMEVNVQVNNMIWPKTLENLDLWQIKNFNKLSFPSDLALKKLRIYQCGNLESLDVSELKELEELDIKFCSKLRELNLSGCKKLKSLSIFDANLGLLDLTQFPALETVYILNSETGITTTVDLRGLRKLHSLTLSGDLSNELICQLDAETFFSLDSLILNHWHEKTPENFAPHNKIKYLNVTGQYATFDFNSFVELERLYMECRFPQLKHFPPTVKEITIKPATSLWDIDLTNLTKLNSLTVESQGTWFNEDSNAVSYINFANCTNLRHILIRSNAQCIFDGIENCKNLASIKFEYEISEEFAISLASRLPAGCNFIYTKQRKNKAENIAVQRDTVGTSYYNQRVETLNDTSPVARFQLNDSFSPDTDTEGGRVISNVSKDDFIAVLEIPGEEVSRHHYRIGLIDDVKMKGKQVIFCRKINNNKISVFPKDEFTNATIASEKAFVRATPGYGLGYLKGTLRAGPGHEYPLPSKYPLSSVKDLEIYCNPKNGVEFLWDDVLKQCYATVKTDMPVEVFYRFKKNLSYEKEPDFTAPLVMKNSKDLLPQEYIDRIQQIEKDPAYRKKLASKPKLAHLADYFDQQKSIQERIQALFKHCEGFRPASLHHPPLDADDDIGKTLACLFERKGTCRHRDEAFMVMTRYLGVPTRMFRNEIHQPCEIPFVDKNGNEDWRLIELGGSEVHDLRPPDLRDNIFEKIAQLPPPSLVKPTQSVLILSPEEMACEEKYYQHFLKCIQQAELSDLDPILNKKFDLPPLIHVTSNQPPFTVHKQIIQQLDAKGINTKSKVLYINSPADFALYLKPYCLIGGERKQIDGPLSSLLDTGGILIVNWSNFTANELASYKSILDTNPTLFDRPVSKNLQVIGLAGPEIETCVPFLKRCQSCCLHPDFFKQSQIEPISMDDDEPFEIDLFHQSHWQEKLLGDITFSGNQILLKNGKLIEAINQNKPLVIYNPPDDDQFDLLLHRIRDEGKILYNGSLVSVPPAVKIKTANKPHKNELKNVKVEMDRSTVGNRQPIYLGLYNFHECNEFLVFDQTKKAHNLPGFLHDYDPAIHYFYITESIPENDWQALLAHIEKEYSDKTFQFVLAPGVEIENVAENKAERASSKINSVKELAQSGIVVSNDTDFACAQLVKQLEGNKEEVIVLDVTPNTSFNELIATMYIKAYPDDPSQVDFIYQEKKIFEALKNGTTIVLNGLISPTLYQHLLPILSNESIIHINGEAVKVAGKLISIQPQQAKDKFLQSSELIYKWEDYDFPPEDTVHVKKISDFYFYANKLPHRGVGRPNLPEVSYSRLKRMVHAVNARHYHQQNPIKGIFHYDYPKQSEDYAYLNVMAKYQFSQQEDKPFHPYKLTQLIKTLSIKNKSDLRNNIWRILNCFSGKELSSNDLLGQYLEGALDFSASYPSLSAKALAKVWRKIQPYLTVSAEKKKKQPHMEKRIQKVAAMLGDPLTPVIMLKGEAGVGKTESVTKLEELLKFNRYDGIAHVLEWLQSSSTNQLHVLMLDEANMALPGTWDFLKGLSRDKRSIYYQGKVYPLSDQHKILITGNPENYPGRYHHAFFQHYAETVVFAMPDDEEIETVILKSILEPAGLYQPAYTKGMLHAYHQVQQLNAPYIYSNRDLQNLAQRFVLLAEEKTNADELQQALYSACVGEFSGTICNVNIRNKYMNQIAQHFGITLHPDAPQYMVPIYRQFSIPSEKAYLIEGIEQDLKLRERAIKNKDKEYYYKRGVVLEGGTRIGKSTLYSNLLEKNGFSQFSIDPKKRYYQVTLDNNTDESKVAEILKKAHREESIVILDEINLSPKLEDLINKLLTDTYDEMEAEKNNSSDDMIQKKQKHPGFMVFASQNPSSYAGCKASSPALRNRMHMLYFDPYSPEALVTMAKDKNIPYPEAYHRAFEKCKIRAGADGLTINVYREGIKKWSPQLVQLQEMEEEIKRIEKRQLTEEDTRLILKKPK